MERRLSEAAMEGSVSYLLELLQEDPLILDRIIVSCISETPLHIAAMLGHLNFVKELLNRSPELATELDARGSSPLHLASAKGHLEIVKELLLANSEISMVRNEDGRIPLHLAAVKGRFEVVSELVSVKPESTRVLTDRGETVLHLCVVHNRLECLQLLVETIGKDDEMINCKDSDGNNILHIAVAKKQIEMVKFLLTSTGVELNALTTIGSTALDILTQSPRDLRDMDIEDSLRHAGAVSAKDLHLIVHDWVPEKAPRITPQLPSQENIQMNPPVKHKHTDWLGRKRSAVMVVTSLIATVAFQAALTPPGGVWQETQTEDASGKPLDKPYKVGTSVMAYDQEAEYGLFMIFNTLAFLSSLSIILLLVSGLPLKRRRWMWTQMVILWISISAQVVTYFLSLRYMSPDNVMPTLKDVTEVSVLAWLLLMVTVFVGNLIRVNRWVLRRFGYLPKKEIVPAAPADEEEEEL